jgi:hypothetical protein
MTPAPFNNCPHPESLWSISYRPHIAKIISSEPYFPFTSPTYPSQPSPYRAYAMGVCEASTTLRPEDCRFRVCSLRNPIHGFSVVDVLEEDGFLAVGVMQLIMSLD